MFIFFLGFTFTSCLNNVDVDQIQDLNLAPTYDASLVYFTVKPTDFIVNGNDLDTVEDVTRFTVFKNNPIIKDNLVKIEVSIAINNKFRRNFKVKFDFLDDNNQLTYSFQELNIPANTVNFTQKEVIDIGINTAFLTTQKMKVTIILPPSNSPLDLNENVFLNFKSGARFFLNF